jgi:hypothetical protein
MMPLKISKRPITLVEVLIAMALTISILMTLTFFYRQVTEIGSETDRVRATNFKKRYIETHLAKILPKAIGKNDSKRDFIFFSTGDEGITKTGSQSLIFTFDNEINLDKEFSGHVLGRIYLDPNGNLFLAYWPSPKRLKNWENVPMKKELLLEGVDNLSFEFYIAPERKNASESIKETKDTDQDAKKDDQKKTTEKKNEPEPEDKKKDVEPEPKGDWRQQTWLQEYNQLPVMVKMTVTFPKEQTPLIFIYPLANNKTHVIYE